MAQLRIAIPFYDRLWLFRHCLATLAKLTQRDHVDFAIYLDHGYEPEAMQAIGELLPEAQAVILPRHLGASGVVHRILSDYAENPVTDRLLLLDADMIVRTDLAATILGWRMRPDMIISVYNSSEHQAIYSSSAPFLHKSRLGATGTLWSPDVARLVIQNVALRGNYDTLISDFFMARGMALCCSNASFAQHLGIYGTNNLKFGNIDYGLNYSPDGPEQASAMAEVFNDMMVNQPFHMGKGKRREKPV